MYGTCGDIADSSPVNVCSISFMAGMKDTNEKSSELQNTTMVERHSASTSSLLEQLEMKCEKGQ